MRKWSLKEVEGLPKATQQARDRAQLEGQSLTLSSWVQPYATWWKGWPGAAHSWEDLRRIMAKASQRPQEWNAHHSQGGLRLVASSVCLSFLIYKHELYNVYLPDLVKLSHDLGRALGLQTALAT